MIMLLLLAGEEGGRAISTVMTCFWLIQLDLQLNLLYILGSRHTTHTTTMISAGEKDENNKCSVRAHCSAYILYCENPLLSLSFILLCQARKK